MPSHDIPPRFKTNPYRDDPSDVLYYTGDLGRYRLDGSVDILGRRDDQVKIRGVRVEPQEVASVLQTCPEVQRCAVLGHSDLKGEMALTAYVVTHPDTSLSVPDLRTFLSARIPHALVPSQYVLLDNLPLSSNGKIDRQALQSLTPTTITQVPYVAPSTVLEELLAKLWQEVLKIERIGIHDNFFDLGGHSLLAARMIARIRNVLEVAIPLRTVFEHPTVSRFAKEIDGLLPNDFQDFPSDTAT
jgi:acyl carrier protein